MISNTILQRLALVRYVFHTAVEQSQQPEPLCGISILTLHDSVEFFLELAAEHMGAARPYKFEDLWKSVSQQLPKGSLSQEATMMRLNRARASLKHHWTLPSGLDLEGFRVAGTNFFAENAPVVFGIEFDSVSMVTLVRCVNARGTLEEANRLLREGKVSDAACMVAKAFDQIMEDYEKRNKLAVWDAPLSFVKSFSFTRSSDMDLPDSQRRLADFVEKVIDSFQSVEDVLRVLALGLDYRRYAKFRMLAPRVKRTKGGKYYFSGTTLSTEIDAEECRYCFDFVIESALRLQDFEFNWGWQWVPRLGLQRVEKGADRRTDPPSSPAT